MTQKKEKSFLFEFVLPASLATLFAFVFNWGPGEVIWGFWAASFWLGVIFCAFLVIMHDAGLLDMRTRLLLFPISFLLAALLSFHLFTALLIIKGGIPHGVYVDDPKFLYVLGGVTVKFFPFIAICVYYEIKDIFFAGLYTGEKFIRYFVVFVKLQLIALSCFYLKRYIPDILLYLIVYCVAFYPIRIFEHEHVEYVPADFGRK